MQGWVLPVLAGPFAGSFLGVLIRRLPAGRPIATARSACEACNRPLGPLELIPLASFAIQRGSCRHCGAPIAWAHPAIELAALAIAAIAAAIVPAGPYPGGAEFWLTCVLGWWLLALAWIDAATFRLPDALTLPLILAGLAEALWLDPDALTDGVITDRATAAALAATALVTIAVVYRRLRGREGIGLGDAKLLAAAGAWTGLAGLPDVMLAGALMALAYALLLRLRGAAITSTTKIPFGPFLAAATWLVWLLSWT